MRTDFIKPGSLCVRAAGRLTTIFLLSIVSLSVFAQTDLRLLEVAKSQDWDAVQSLLNGKALDINATQADGATALAYAVSTNSSAE